MRRRRTSKRGGIEIDRETKRRGGKALLVTADSNYSYSRTVLLDSSRLADIRLRSRCQKP